MSTIIRRDVVSRRIDPADGRPRCTWAAVDPMLAAYHDREWGRAIRTDAGHLERMALEIFQCGLSWKIVLVKRPALRRAFGGFAVERVAAMTRRDVDKLCQDAEIIRNRRKIEAVIGNAQIFLKIGREHRSYVRWFHALPAETSAERGRLYDIFQEAFSFMGPETCKCYFMGTGKIAPAHERRCWLKQS